MLAFAEDCVYSTVQTTNMILYTFFQNAWVCEKYISAIGFLLHRESSLQEAAQHHYLYCSYVKLLHSKNVLHTLRPKPFQRFSPKLMERHNGVSYCIPCYHIFNKLKITATRSTQTLLPEHNSQQKARPSESLSFAIVQKLPKACSKCLI